MQETYEALVTLPGGGPMGITRAFCDVDVMPAYWRKNNLSTTKTSKGTSSLKKDQSNFKSTARFFFGHNYSYATRSYPSEGSNTI